MKIIMIALFGIFSNLITPDRPQLNTSTVKSVDLKRYMGKWYEIARFDVIFERGMNHVTATYSLNPNGTVAVVNQGYKDGKQKTANGKAKLRYPNDASQLKVSFFLWFYADYNILELDTLNYSYALIGSSSNKYLWILSRTPTLSNQTLNQLLRAAKARGYDTNNFIFCDQRPTTLKTEITK